MRETDRDPSRPAADTETGRILLRLGAALFLLGLLTGFTPALTANPRMALSAHLEGVLNGMFLMVVALAWDRFVLGARARRWLVGLLGYGTYANWGTTLLAACFGTGTSTPIAGAGHQGAPWQELLVAVGLVSLSFAMLAALVLLLSGTRRPTAGADEARGDGRVVVAGS